MSQDSLDKLEKSIIQSINSLKDEIVNLKDIVIKNLQEENARLKVKFEKLENRVAILESNHNDLAQYGRWNSVVFSGIPENVPKTQKTIVRFVNRKNCEKVLANKKTLEAEE